MEASQIGLFDIELPPPVKPAKVFSPEAEWLQRNQTKKPHQLFAKLTIERQEAAMKQLASWIRRCVKAGIMHKNIVEEKGAVWQEILMSLLRQQEIGALPVDALDWSQPIQWEEQAACYPQYVSPKDKSGYFSFEVQRHRDEAKKKKAEVVKA